MGAGDRKEVEGGNRRRGREIVVGMLKKNEKNLIGKKKFSQ